ncbi:MAG: hypothetical protein ACON42_08975 [Flavobacteriaceae bacterium]
MNALIFLSNGLLLLFFAAYFLHIDYVVLGAIQQLLILPAFALQFGLSIYISLHRIINKRTITLIGWIHLAFSLFWIGSFWI